MDSLICEGLGERLIGFGMDGMALMAFSRSYDEDDDGVEERLGGGSLHHLLTLWVSLFTWLVKRGLTGQAGVRCRVLFAFHSPICIIQRYVASV